MSSKRRVRYNHCTRKKAYLTLEDAKQAMFNMKRHSSSNMTGVRIYKCQFGSHYHIGHKSGLTWSKNKGKPFKPKY